MAEAATTATRVCPECGLDIPVGARDCPCCGCAPGGTGLVDHLPPADNDNRFVPVAFVGAGLVAGEAVLLALAPVAAVALGAAAAVGFGARALLRRR